ncbi:MAG: DUF1294 domain-containing protein [Candidatus Moraniibacteriota bacterium]
MNRIPSILIAVFLLINLGAFSVMLVDKNRSRKGGVERISEGMLFFLATAFGSFGVYAGMFAVRHKTRKWYFLVGIPLLMLQNLALLYIVFLLVSGRL